VAGLLFCSIDSFDQYFGFYNSFVLYYNEVINQQGGLALADPSY